MADDWQVGDLALCVRVGKWVDYGIGPRAGSVTVVTRIYGLDEVSPIGDTPHPCFLEFEEWAPDNTFGCLNFRKIRPLGDSERDSFMADLRIPETAEA
jgi:hypothetical protein